MIKAFYKPKPMVKLFYDKNMNFRAPAYGEDVYHEFIQWLNFYLNKKKIFADKYHLWRGADLFGEPYDEQKSDKKNMTDPILPPLFLEDMCYQLEGDGHVSVNGRRTSFVLKVEPKAWSIAVFPKDGCEKKVLFAIGKSLSSEDVWLLAFDIKKSGISERPIAMVSLAPTIDRKSKLLCFGKHIFLVHNSKLDYFYFDDERGSLDRVAIGEDKDNSELEWCSFASSVVANGLGSIYWISDQCVYGFLVGYPRVLTKIECGIREKIVHIRSDKNSLYVYRKDKNTGTVSCYRYVESSDGKFVGELCDL